MYHYLHVGRASDLDVTNGKRLYRLLEILPGFLAWLTLILIVVLSFFEPLIIAVFIIIFDVYWLIKTIYLSLHLRVSYNKLRENLKINWLDKLKKLDTGGYQIRTIKTWEDVYHLIFLPLYKEDFELVSASVEGLFKTNYPKEKMIVVLCWEERGGEETQQVVAEIEKIYANKFYGVTAKRWRK